MNLLVMVIKSILSFFKNNLNYLILFLIIYIPVFGYLDILPIRIWDEARLAINAYEMYKNGDFITTYYVGNPDLWNTKPPLLIWVQVFFMKILGVNELAIRLPSAIAALFTCILLIVLFKKYLKNNWLGYISVFVLITSNGYIDIHASRTGDYDALLTLFTTLSGLLFYVYCEKKNIKYLYCFFIVLALSVLTKSVTGLLFLPALFIYSIIQKQFIPIIKNKHFYFGILSFLFIVAGYYVLREAKNPGYFEAVKANELGGRFLETLENNNHGFWFYYNNLVGWKFSVWYLFVPCGLLIGFFFKDKKVNRLTLFTTLMIVVYFIVVSLAQTKLLWYDVPLYPFLAISVSLFIYFIFDLIRNSETIKNNIAKNIISYVFLLIIGITPYKNIINKTYLPQDYGLEKEFYEIGYYLRNAIKGEHDLNNQYVLYDGYNAQLLFYTNILNDNGVKISFKDWKYLSKNDIVITQHNNIKNYIKENYDYMLFYSKGNVVKYKINERK